MRRYFTLKTAREALLMVRLKLASLMILKGWLESARDEVARLEEHVKLMGGVNLDVRAAKEVFQQAREAERDFREGLESLRKMGVLVRDLEAGIVDFPALSRGREVMLCWSRGEEDILWWHGANEGIAGRRPVDAEFEASLEC